MKINNSLFILGSLILSSHLAAAPQGINVIYGDDNRRDVYESNDAILVELSRSTAAMVPMGNLQVNNGEVQINGTSMSDRGLCATERFAHQVSAANCSGFLVSENVLVTAGHCIKTEDDCRNYKWVFDFKMDSAEQTSAKVLEESVYACKKIISRSLDIFSKDDYAVIELDRKVTDRRPLTFRRTGKVSVGTPIAVIGHPSGLPTKIADGANVRSLAGKFFVANLDTYGGNSGSAVFNAQTSEVEGILVRGETDYVYDSVRKCTVSNVCANSACRGEDVTYITNISALRTIP